jgi:phosphoenolpyruvate synthase/pyruvate phosphate dikinase
MIYRPGGSESVATSREERQAPALAYTEIQTLSRWGAKIVRHRDSADLAHLFDGDADAVKAMTADAIRRRRKVGVSIGIRGQAPSDRTEFQVREGIASISLNPDSVVDFVRRAAALEEA